MNASKVFSRLGNLQREVLRVLVLRGSLTPSRVARFVGKDVKRVFDALKRLEKRGLVECVCGRYRVRKEILRDVATFLGLDSIHVAESKESHLDSQGCERNSSNGSFSSHIYGTTNTICLDSSHSGEDPRYGIAYCILKALVSAGGVLPTSAIKEVCNIASMSSARTWLRKLEKQGLVTRTGYLLRDDGVRETLWKITSEGEQVFLHRVGGRVLRDVVPDVFSSLVLSVRPYVQRVFRKGYKGSESGVSAKELCGRGRCYLDETPLSVLLARVGAVEGSLELGYDLFVSAEFVDLLERCYGVDLGDLWIQIYSDRTIDGVVVHIETRVRCRSVYDALHGFEWLALYPKPINVFEAVKMLLEKILITLKRSVSNDSLRVRV